MKTFTSSYQALKSGLTGWFAMRPCGILLLLLLTLVTGKPWLLVHLLTFFFNNSPTLSSVLMWMFGGLLLISATFSKMFRSLMWSSTQPMLKVYYQWMNSNYCPTMTEILWQHWSIFIRLRPGDSCGRFGHARFCSSSASLSDSKICSCVHWQGEDSHASGCFHDFSYLCLDESSFTWIGVGQGLSPCNEADHLWGLPVWYCPSGSLVQCGTEMLREHDCSWCWGR